MFDRCGAYTRVSVMLDNSKLSSVEYCLPVILLVVETLVLPSIPTSGLRQ